ncbi:peptidylprolyl isomerase [Natrinema sp. CBA1119]|nr:peptidylprolyl isomerase [Natrinema sp. CBA1119]
MALAGCAGDKTEDTEPDASGSSEAGAPSGGTTATIRTSEGDIDVELYDERAPRTVENFVGLATGERAWIDPETGDTIEGEPLYDDVIFHRVIEGFMIQTGDPTGTGRGGPGYQFDDEFHPELRHDDAGILSMANSGPDTNGSQFFITLGPQPHLDDRHSVFGKVTDVSASDASGGLEDERSESSSGMDVVREIGDVDTNATDQPKEDIVLESVSVDDE